MRKGTITKCRVCNEYRERAQEGHRICKPCMADYQRAYNERHRERIAKRQNDYWARKAQSDPEFRARYRVKGRAYHRKNWHDAIMAYGGYRCACCGETEPKFLSIDHINNDGAEHRKTISRTLGEIRIVGRPASGTANLLLWLKRNNYPDGFQVLCMNCNTGKQRNNGVCPHKASSLRKPRENGETPDRTIPWEAVLGFAA